MEQGLARMHIPGVLTLESMANGNSETPSVYTVENSIMNSVADGAIKDISELLR